MRTSWGSLVAAAVIPAALFLAGCTQTGPVEFSLSGADTSLTTNADDLDFGPMDRTVSACKSVSRNAGSGRCTKVRAYEACMKDKGYITLLGPENPSGCGEPAWGKRRPERASLAGTPWRAMRCLAPASAGAALGVRQYLGTPHQVHRPCGPLAAHPRTIRHAADAALEVPSWFAFLNVIWPVLVGHEVACIARPDVR